jgi:hypothetical protein
VAEPALDPALLAEEERGWTELHALVDSLPPDRVEEPGYFAEGWSAKDLIAHIGSWLAEAAAVLERIRFGTYRPGEIDIDATNEAFFEAMRGARSPNDQRTPIGGSASPAPTTIRNTCLASASGPPNFGSARRRRA